MKSFLYFMRHGLILTIVSTIFSYFSLSYLKFDLVQTLIFSTGLFIIITIIILVIKIRNVPKNQMGNNRETTQ